MEDKLQTAQVLMQVQSLSIDHICPTVVVLSLTDPVRGAAPGGVNAGVIKPARALAV